MFESLLYLQFARFWYWAFQWKHTWRKWSYQWANCKKYNCASYRKDIVKDDEIIAAHEDDETQMQSMNSLEKDAIKYTNQDNILVIDVFVCNWDFEQNTRCSLDLIN